MKKRITVCAFLILIFLTALLTVVQAVRTYNYDIVHYDILEGFGAAITLGIGGFVVLYELDLFYVVYYFLFRPKTKAKNVLNIISNLLLISVFVFSILLNRYMELRKFEHVPALLIAAYVIIRLVSLFVQYILTLKTEDRSASDL